MPRLIWVFAGRTVTLLVLSCRGSFIVSNTQSSCDLALWLGLAHAYRLETIKMHVQLGTWSVSYSIHTDERLFVEGTILEMRLFNLTFSSNKITVIAFTDLTLHNYGDKISVNYVPHRRGGGHIVFGADPVGVGVSVSVGVTLSCLHDISWTGCRILTKFAWM